MWVEPVSARPGTVAIELRLVSPASPASEQLARELTTELTAHGATVVQEGEAACRLEVREPTAGWVLLSLRTPERNNFV